MDSLPQEAIDEIIGVLPHSSLRSSSLVARRWRQQSQQRLFATVWFHSECKVKRWHIGTKTDQGGISSYVRYADFHDIDSWNDPTLFVRLLEGFSSLRTLWVYKTEIPSELLGHILRGEVGKGITTLHLWSPRCPLSTTASIILSLPDLENLTVGFCNTKLGGPPSTHTISPQRQQLNELELCSCSGEIADVLIQSQFSFRYLSLAIDIPGIQQLVELSSGTAVGLKFQGAQCLLLLVLRNAPPITFTDITLETPSPSIDLPPLLALTSLQIRLYTCSPSRRLTKILSSIPSAPALTSIAFEYGGWGGIPRAVDLSTWADADKFLARIAKGVNAKGGLVLTLKPWPSDQMVWEWFLPQFREAGGKIRTCS